MEFNDIIKARWSVRSFSDKKVEQDKILRILEIAQTAPTAKNMQPVRIICAHSEKAISDFRRISPCTYGAVSYTHLDVYKRQVLSVKMRCVSMHDEKLTSRTVRVH